MPARTMPGGAGTAFGRRVIWFCHNWFFGGTGVYSTTSSRFANRELNSEVLPLSPFNQAWAVVTVEPISGLAVKVPFWTSVVLPATGLPSMASSHIASWKAMEAVEPVNDALSQAVS